MVKRPGSKMRVAGQPLLVLKTIGGSSGKERQTVLGYWADEGSGDGSLLVIASNMGAASHPAWLFNMARHPEQVWIERDGTRGGGEMKVAIAIHSPTPGDPMLLQKSSRQIARAVRSAIGDSR